MSNDDLFAADDAATPLTSDERRDLKRTHIGLRRELNEAEAINVAKGQVWALAQKRGVLDETFLKTLHERMFGDVWRWAGAYRESEKNIGVAAYGVPTAVVAAIAEAKAWVEYDSWPIDEIAVRFHHRLVAIHPFANGNGRWSRLVGDLLARQLGGEPLSWGRKSLVAASQTRQAYVKALKLADAGDMLALLEFARS